MKILEKVIVASRGRNPQNPSDRTPGAEVEQRLEVNTQGTANTLTSVQKDNLVLETCYGIYTGVSDEFQRGPLKDISRTLKAATHDTGVIVPVIYQRPRGNNKGGVHKISPTITGCAFHENNFLVSQYRIRKLIPLECWRLMDFTDEDFRKAAAVNSNNQLYKQAGNSIVKAVMAGIMSQLNIKGVVPWNERQTTTPDI